MKENTAKLIELITGNPDLPVIAMVDNELICGDFGRLLAKFGNVSCDEYALYNDEYFDDREDFKERYYNYNDDVLCDKFGYNPMINEYSVRSGQHTQLEFEENNQKEEKLERYLDEVAEKAFKKAIIVDINAFW